MSLTEKEAAATSSTKAITGTASGSIVPTVVGIILEAIEGYYMITIPLEIKLGIIGVISGVVTGALVWIFPNKPKEVTP